MLRRELHYLKSRILNDLGYDSLTNDQRLKLLYIALKHSLPKQSIEQHIIEDIPQVMQITFVDSDGNEKVNRKSLDNFKFKDLAG